MRYHSHETLSKQNGAARFIYILCCCDIRFDSCIAAIFISLSHTRSLTLRCCYCWCGCDCWLYCCCCCCFGLFHNISSHLKLPGNMLSTQIPFIMNRLYIVTLMNSQTIDYNTAISTCESMMQLSNSIHTHTTHQVHKLS